MQGKSTVDDPLLLQFPDEAKAVMHGAVDTHCRAAPP